MNRPTQSRLATATLAAGLLLAAFALWLWVSGRELSISRERIALTGRFGDPMVGKAAPALALTLLDGAETTLAGYRGHPLVINYWATWCEPCKAEMPLLQQSYGKYGPRLVVLGANAGEDPADVSRVVEALGVTFPIVLDADYDLEAGLGVMAYPTTAFIDSDGIIQARHVGQLDQALLDLYLGLIGIGK